MLLLDGRLGGRMNRGVAQLLELGQFLLVCLGHLLTHGGGILSAPAPGPSGLDGAAPQGYTSLSEASGRAVSPRAARTPIRMHATTRQTRFRAALAGVVGALALLG